MICLRSFILCLFVIVSCSINVADYKSARTAVRPSADSAYYFVNSELKGVFIRRGTSYFQEFKDLEAGCSPAADVRVDQYLITVMMTCPMQSRLVVAQAVATGPEPRFTSQIQRVPIMARHAVLAPFFVVLTATDLNGDPVRPQFSIWEYPQMQQDTTRSDVSEVHSIFIGGDESIYVHALETFRIGGSVVLGEKARWFGLVAVVYNTQTSICVMLTAIDQSTRATETVSDPRNTRSLTSCAAFALLGITAGTLPHLDVAVVRISSTTIVCNSDTLEHLADVVVSVHNVQAARCGSGDCSDGIRSPVIPTAWLPQRTNALLQFRAHCSKTDPTSNDASKDGPQFHFLFDFVGVIEDHHGSGLHPGAPPKRLMLSSSRATIPTSSSAISTGSFATLTEDADGEHAGEKATVVTVYYLTWYGRIVFVTSVRLDETYHFVSFVGPQASNGQLIMDLLISRGPDGSPLSTHEVVFSAKEVMWLDRPIAQAAPSTARLERQRGPVAAGDFCAAVVDPALCTIDIIRWEPAPLQPFYAESLFLEQCAVGLPSLAFTASVDVSPNCRTVASTWELGSTFFLTFHIKSGGPSAGAHRSTRYDMKVVEAMDNFPRSDPALDAGSPPRSQRAALIRSDVSDDEPCALFGIPTVPTVTLAPDYSPKYVRKDAMPAASNGAQSFGRVFHACKRRDAVEVQGYIAPSHKELAFGFSVATASATIDTPDGPKAGTAFAISGSLFTYLGEIGYLGETITVEQFPMAWPLGAWNPPRTLPPTLALSSTHLVIGYSDEGSCACGRLVRPAPLLQCGGSGAVARYGYFLHVALLNAPVRLAVNLSLVMKPPCDAKFRSHYPSPAMGGSLGRSYLGASVALPRGVLTGRASPFAMVAGGLPTPSVKNADDLYIEGAIVPDNPSSEFTPTGAVFVVDAGAFDGSTGGPTMSLSSTIAAPQWPVPKSGRDTRVPQATFVAFADGADVVILVTGGRVVMAVTKSVEGELPPTLQAPWSDILRSVPPTLNRISAIGTRPFGTTIAVGAYGRFAMAYPGVASFLRSVDVPILLFQRDAAGYVEIQVSLGSLKDRCNVHTSCGASLALAGPYLVVGAPTWRGNCARPQGIVIVSFIKYAPGSAIPIQFNNAAKYSDGVITLPGEFLVTDGFELRDESLCEVPSVLDHGPHAITGATANSFGWHVDAIRGSVDGSVTVLVGSAKHSKLLLFRDIKSRTLFGPVSPAVPKPLVADIAGSSLKSTLPPSYSIAAMSFLRQVSDDMTTVLARGERALRATGASFPSYVFSVSRVIVAGSSDCTTHVPTLYLVAGSDDSVDFTRVEWSADDGAVPLHLSSENGHLAWVTARDMCTDSEASVLGPGLSVHTLSVSTLSSRKSAKRKHSHPLAPSHPASMAAVTGGTLAITAGLNGWYALASSECGGKDAGGTVTMLVRPTAPPDPAGGPAPVPIDASHFVSEAYTVQRAPPASLACDAIGVLVLDGAVGGGDGTVLTAVSAPSASHLSSLEWRTALFPGTYASTVMSTPPKSYEPPTPVPVVSRSPTPAAVAVPVVPTSTPPPPPPLPLPNNHSTATIVPTFSPPDSVPSKAWSTRTAMVPPTVTPTAARIPLAASASPPRTLVPTLVAVRETRSVTNPTPTEAASTMTRRAVQAVGPAGANPSSMLEHRRANVDRSMATTVTTTAGSMRIVSRVAVGTTLLTNVCLQTASYDDVDSIDERVVGYVLDLLEGWLVDYPILPTSVNVIVLTLVIIAQAVILEAVVYVAGLLMQCVGRPSSVRREGLVQLPTGWRYRHGVRYTAEPYIFGSTMLVSTTAMTPLLSQASASAVANVIQAHRPYPVDAAVALLASIVTLGFILIQVLPLLWGAVHTQQRPKERLAYARALAMHERFQVQQATRNSQLGEIISFSFATPPVPPARPPVPHVPLDRSPFVFLPTVCPHASDVGGELRLCGLNICTLGPLRGEVCTDERLSDKVGNDGLWRAPRGRRRTEDCAYERHAGLHASPPGMQPLWRWWKWAGYRLGRWEVRDPELTRLVLPTDARSAMPKAPSASAGAPTDAASVTVKGNEYGLSEGRPWTHALPLTVARLAFFGNEVPVHPSYRVFGILSLVMDVSVGVLSGIELHCAAFWWYFGLGSAALTVYAARRLPYTKVGVTEGYLITNVGFVMVSILGLLRLSGATSMDVVGIARICGIVGMSAGILLELAAELNVRIRSSADATRRGWGGRLCAQVPQDVGVYAATVVTKSYEIYAKTVTDAAASGAPVPSAVPFPQRHRTSAFRILLGGSPSEAPAQGVAHADGEGGDSVHVLHRAWAPLLVGRHNRANTTAAQPQLAFIPQASMHHVRSRMVLGGASIAQRTATAAVPVRPTAAPVAPTSPYRTQTTAPPGAGKKSPDAVAALSPRRKPKVLTEGPPAHVPGSDRSDTSADDARRPTGRHAAAALAPPHPSNTAGAPRSHDALCAGSVPTREAPLIDDDDVNDHHGDDTATDHDTPEHTPLPLLLPLAAPDDPAPTLPSVVDMGRPDLPAIPVPSTSATATPSSPPSRSTPFRVASDAVQRPPARPAAPAMATPPHRSILSPSSPLGTSLSLPLSPHSAPFAAPTSPTSMRQANLIGPGKGMLVWSSPHAYPTYVEDSTLATSHSVAASASASSSRGEAASAGTYKGVVFDPSNHIRR